MIILDVADYCQNCARFEPTADTAELFAGGKVYHRQTTVICKHRDVCNGIYKRMLNEMKKSREKPENSEPVCQTWGKWLEDTFGEPYLYLQNTPIPADLAQKLGLQPKEG